MEANWFLLGPVIISLPELVIVYSLLVLTNAKADAFFPLQSYQSRVRVGMDHAKLVRPDLMPARSVQPSLVPSWLVRHGLVFARLVDPDWAPAWFVGPVLDPDSLVSKGPSKLLVVFP